MSFARSSRFAHRPDSSRLGDSASSDSGLGRRRQPARAGLRQPRRSRVGARLDPRGRGVCNRPREWPRATADAGARGRFVDACKNGSRGPGPWLRGRGRHRTGHAERRYGGHQQAPHPDAHCLAEAHLWLGDLDVAQAMYRKRWTHACWNRMPPRPCGSLIASGPSSSMSPGHPSWARRPPSQSDECSNSHDTRSAAGDRRDPVRLTQHCEVAHAFHLPQARRELAARRGHQGPRTGTAAPQRMAPQTSPGREEVASLGRCEGCSIRSAVWRTVAGPGRRSLGGSA
jgi:hypothetical protein